MAQTTLSSGDRVRHIPTGEIGRIGQILETHPTPGWGPIEFLPDAWDDGEGCANFGVIWAQSDDIEIA